MSMPILYTFRRCPYAMRARFALAYAGINCHIREVDLKNKPAELLSLSPKGTVPVLSINEQHLIEQSLEIMRWAVTQSDPEGWLDFSEKQHEFGHIVMEMNDSEFIPRLMKYKYFERYPEESQSTYASQLLPSLAELNLRFAKMGGFLLGNRCSFYDIGLFPFIRQFAKVDLDFFEKLPYSSLKKWLAFFENTVLFQQIMKKHPVWDSTQSSYYLLEK